MDESLSFPELIKRSKSITLHPKLELDIKSVRQIGDYTLGPEVGCGAFGKVVLGKHTLTGESVAIKILDKMILSQTPEDYELVKQEISILKIVKHKYIVQLYEILQTPQHIYIIMEYCEGKDLMDFILSKQHLTELESLKYFQQLINALFYLHSQNIAHRDVKIDNMLLDKNKDLKLVDFGLSTKYTDETLLDQPCGTVVYAAPEVLEGNDYHGMLADVWSSGIVLYGMTSGFLPFSDKDDEVNKKNVLEGKIEIPDFFSPMLKDLLKHMLDINPITRYTLQEIKQHPWFNLNKINLIPGIIIGYNMIPVDENILNLCVAYNADKDKVENSVRNNKYDSGSALYYLLVRKITKKGFQSISDLSSESFIRFILNDDNLIKRKIYIGKNINNENSRNRHRDSSQFNSTLNMECYLSSSRNMENLGAAPRLMPSENNSNNNVSNNNCNNNSKDKEKNNKNKEVLVKQKRRNKINSVIKNNNKNKENKYITKNSDNIVGNKKPFVYNKNEIKFQIKNENKNKQKRINNSANIRTKYIKKVNMDKYDNDTISGVQDDSTFVKSKKTRNGHLSNINNDNCQLEFKSITENVDFEIKNKKNKNKKEENKNNKTPLKSNKKYLKQSTLEIYKKNSDKIKNKYKNKKKINKDLKCEKERQNHSINNNKKIHKNEKFQGNSGNSCINIKTNNFLKTPNKINNTQITTNIKGSNKNIYSNKRNTTINILDKNGNYLNISTSDRLDKFTNLKNCSQNKQRKNISKSIHTVYNSNYYDSKKTDESRILFSSRKKRDFSLFHKKNNITSILGLNHYKIKTNESIIGTDLYDSSKLFLSDKKKKFYMNSLNLSLNKSTSNYSNQFKNKVNPLVNNRRKQTEYKIENTIYELNNKKNKNKNRIRLNYYNPNKIYELTSGDDNKKKNNLNKSVTLGKADEKKLTGLSIYMNSYNYNKQRTKRINLESSVLTSRKLNNETIRDLSYSPNLKYLNEKTRRERIPWKYQKKGIDSKLNTETIYNKYLNKINKNPLNPNGNKKIKILRKKKNVLNENNNSTKRYDIINNNTLQSIKDEYENKRRLSQEKRGRRVNNHQRDKSNSIRNIKESNKLSTKKLNISISTKNQINAIEHKLLEKKNNNNFNIFDLSCLIIKEKTIKECNQKLITKLKRNGFNIISNKINEIRCSKNRIICEIDINKIKDDYSDRNIFCYKINNKRPDTQVNKVISKIILQ